VERPVELTQKGASAEAEFIAPKLYSTLLTTAWTFLRFKNPTRNLNRINEDGSGVRPGDFRDGQNGALGSPWHFLINSLKSFESFEICFSTHDEKSLR
jgi:hypothetical protein